MNNTTRGATNNNIDGTIPDSNFQNPYSSGTGNFKKRTIIEGEGASDENIPEQLNTLAGFLVSFSKFETGEYWELREGNNGIGTSQENSIILNESHVSGNHAKLNVSKDSKNNKWRFQLVDLSSSNGTFINDDRLGIYTGFDISSNDKIKVGEYELILIPADKFINSLVKNPNFKSLQSFDYSSKDLYSDNDYTRPA